MLHHLFLLGQTTAPATGVTGAPPWMEVLLSLLGVCITVFLVPFLKNQAAAAKAAAEASGADMALSNVSTGQVLAERLKAFLLGTAAAIAEKEYPRIADGIVKGHYKGATEVKAELYALGELLQNQAVAYFDRQGIDIIAAFGEAQLRSLIARAVNSISPFPGKETAAAFLDVGVAPLVVKYGVEYMRKLMLARMPATADDVLQAAVNEPSPTVAPVN